MHNHRQVHHDLCSKHTSDFMISSRFTYGNTAVTGDPPTCVVVHELLQLAVAHQHCQVLFTIQVATWHVAIVAPEQPAQWASSTVATVICITPGMNKSATQQGCSMPAADDTYSSN